MRSLFVGALIAASVVCQSPLATLTGGTNQGNAGGGLYFDLQVNTTVTFTQFDVRCGTATTTPTTGTGLLEVYLGPSTYVGNVTNPALWAVVSTGTGTVGPSLVASFTLAGGGFALGPGNYAIALKSQATGTGGNVAWGFGYTNGLGNNTPLTCGAIPGSCLNTIFSNLELTLRGGAAQNAFLTGGIFQPRMYNGALHYTLGGTPIAVASWQPYGTGCVRKRTSCHELFPNPASVDVSNTTISHALHVGNGYTVTHPAGAYVAPGGGALTGVFADGNADVLLSTILGAAPPPILYPNAGGVGVATDCMINADGFITPLPGTNPWAAPTVPGFLAGGPRWVPHWKNMNVAAGGTITAEISGGDVVISWNGVNDNGVTSTFQVAFLGGGTTVEYRYGTMSGGGGGGFPAIIGFCYGGGVLANEKDVSVDNFWTQDSDFQEMTCAMTARPLLGTSPSFVASNLPAGGTFGFSLLSFFIQDPGVSVAGFGAPMDCNRYLALAPGPVTQFKVASGVPLTLSQVFAIPLSTVFNGTTVGAQFVSSAPMVPDPLKFTFSNGVRMTIGAI